MADSPIPEQFILTASGSECPPSERVDGKLHSWRFDGDSPLVICVYCDEMRDAISGYIIRPGRETVVPL